MRYFPLILLMGYSQFTWVDNISLLPILPSLSWFVSRFQGKSAISTAGLLHKARWGKRGLRQKEG